MVGVDPLYVASGLLVGTLVGMTGVGGGSLMTPILILLFGVHPSTAVGTDLLFAAGTKSAGTLMHGRNRTIAWPVVGWLAAGSIPFTAATLFILGLNAIEGPAVRHVTTTALSIALILTAFAILLRPWLIARYGGWSRGLAPRRRAALTMLLGAVLGMLVSMSSVGAGALGVTALILLYPSLPTARIVGSDIAHAVPLTLLAGMGHWWLGTINFAMLGTLLLGSLPGIVAGSIMASRIPDAVLRPILAVTLLVAGGRLLL